MKNVVIGGWKRRRFDKSLLLGAMLEKGYAVFDFNMGVFSKCPRVSDVV